MMCVMASGSCCSLVPEPDAVDVEGRVDDNDCDRLANEVIVRSRYVMRTVTSKRGVIFVKHWEVKIFNGGRFKAWRDAITIQ